MTRVAVLMPNTGPDSDTGKIVSWLKDVGDSVDRGESIAEIETEKVTVEMEALASGILVEITRQPGEDVPVGEVIAWLDDGT